MRIASKLSLTGVVASVMNQPANKRDFAAAVEEGIHKGPNGNKVSVIDVLAEDGSDAGGSDAGGSDAGGRRTRRLLAGLVDVTFKVS